MVQDNESDSRTDGVAVPGIESRLPAGMCGDCIGRRRVKSRWVPHAVA
jgi:hypothetical protein